MSPLARLEAPYDSVQADARELARKIEPFSVAADSIQVVHAEVLDALRASGLMALNVPGAYGGRFDRVDPLSICVVREVLMGVCSQADSLFALQGIGSYPITVGGSYDQRAEWLPKVASGEVLAALGLTEAEAGSDLKNIKTTAEVRAGGVVLNGRKTFISNAGAAAFYAILAREGSGLSMFLVPADTPGLSTQAGPELGAPHVIGDVEMRDVRLPASARLGEQGGGLALTLSTLAVFRVSVAAAAVGLAQVALEEATRHAGEREQFGRPLIRLGPVAGLLADSWADVESARLLTYEAARLAREDPGAHIEHSSLAKVAATEACSRVVDRCVQAMGRWGLLKDSRIERCYRQARPMRIYEGASEVLRLGIARQLAREIGPAGT
jgi:acyl-CoA dehydrogenase